MMKVLIVTALALICFLTGCTKYWYQEGKTFGECGQELRECRYEMQKYRDDAQYSLGVYDLRFEKDCMESRGYRLVKERGLPYRVRRQGPNTSRGEKYGTAGTLEE
ncbi:MAG: hypothetical protein ACYTFW_08020 [Planctomycetota bacterium]|jgi:hypothetical protein